MVRATVAIPVAGVFRDRRHRSIDLSRFRPELLWIQTSLLPRLFTQSTDHIPCLATAISQRTRRGDAIFTPDNTSIRPRQRKYLVDKGSRFRCFRVVRAFIQVDEHYPGIDNPVIREV